VSSFTHHLLPCVSFGKISILLSHASRHLNLFVIVTPLVFSVEGIQDVHRVLYGFLTKSDLIVAITAWISFHWIDVPTESYLDWSQRIIHAHRVGDAVSEHCKGMFHVGTERERER